MRFKKYSKYKDSGIEWIGEIPEHWEVRKLKFKTYIETGDSISDNLKGNFENIEEESYPYISTKDIDLESSCINYENGLKIPKSENNFKIARKHSVILCVEGGSAGKKIAFTNQDICFVNKLAAIKADNNTNAKYLFYLLKGSSFKKQFDISLNGLIGGVSTNILKNFVLYFPPKQEQIEIAKFLDKKTDSIDKAIKTKEKLIEKLKELKQSIINEAVTKGLNKGVKYKDSGIEWIGTIPEHWEVRKLKYCLKIYNGQDCKEVISDEGYPIIGSGGQFAYAKTFLYDGEVLLFGRKGTIDKPQYYNGKFWTVDTMFYAVVNKNNFAKFLYYASLSIPFEYYSTSTALPSMTQFDLNNHKIPLPPKLEQIQIAKYLDKKTANIDKAIELQQLEIEKLKEYKSSLIDSVVTGKIKVI